MSDGRCAVRLTRRYAAAPAEVWAALTDAESLGRWLGEHDWARAGGRVRDAVPERLLELDWRAPGEELSLLRFELTADGDGTVLVLDHRLIEEPLGMTYVQQWTRRVGRLDVHVGGLGR